MPLAQRGDQSNEAIRGPIIFQTATESKLRQVSKHATVIDNYGSLLEELFKVDHPQLIGHPEYREKLEAFLEKEGSQNPSAGRWVFFPWRNTLIHVLSEANYFKVRTARNRELITHKEQKKFRDSRVGIAGLSVGNGVGAVLTMTGGPKFMKLADPDTLDLSNLNRLRGSIAYLGKGKAEMMAHQLWELDPDVNLELWENGLTDEGLKDFILKPRVDVLIDEMDDLRLKILLRVEAKKAKVPVIMATDNDDGVLLDIERFDLEPDRPILHGLIDDIDYLNLPNPLSLEDKVKLSSSIVGKEHISERMMHSLREIGNSIPTWPQLGTAAVMSSAVAAYAVRQALVGHAMPSQRVLLTPNKALDTEPN